MTRNRKRIVTSIAVTAVAAGVLAGGGAVIAAASATPAAATAASAGPSCGMENGHGFGRFGGMHAHGFGRFGGMHAHGQQPVLAAAAGYLGMTQTQLRTQLQAGKSFADVARAQGKPVPGLENAILAAITSHVNASTGLTAEQKQTILAQVKSNLDDIVNAAHPAGPGHGPMWAR